MKVNWVIRKVFESLKTSMQESLLCSRYHVFTLRRLSAMVISFSSGTRRSASKPLLLRAETNPDATMRLNLYSRKRPYGLRLPAVSEL